MTWPFLIFAALTVAGAIAAMSLRNLVHCALSLVVTFAGLAALFLQLNAQFVGFVQVLVYIGAVAILIVFAILLTRGSDPAAPVPMTTSVWLSLGLTAAVFLTLAAAVLSSVVSRRSDLPKAATSVRALGDRLMQEYVLPLEVMGLLLTAALLGAVVIAMQDKARNS